MTKQLREDLAKRHQGKVVEAKPEIVKDKGSILILHKLSKLCPMLEKKVAREECKKKHATRFTDCIISNVVYEAPMNCGHVYIGQTGRCFNERAREHRLAVRSNSGGHISDHRITKKGNPLSGLIKS